MLTYKEVYDNQNFGKVREFHSLADIQQYADETWAYASNTEAKIFPQENQFIPGKYFISDKEYIAQHCADVIISVKGQYPFAKKGVFVAGKIYNEDIEMRTNTVWHYLFHISE